MQRILLHLNSWVELGTHLKIHCPRCKCEFSVPQVTPQEWAQVIETDQAGNTIGAIKLLRQFSRSADLYDSKATILHVSHGNLCHRCKQPIIRDDPGISEIVCEKCKSLNILRLA